MFLRCVLVAMPPLYRWADHLLAGSDAESLKSNLYLRESSRSDAFIINEIWRRNVYHSGQEQFQTIRIEEKER